MASPPSLRDRLRYAMDTMLSRGAVVMSIWLGLLTVLLVVAVAVADWSLQAAPDAPGLAALIWMSLLRALDPGTMGADQGSGFFLASMLFVTLAGIVIVSTLIGIINNAIVARLEKLRKGRSRVIENDHTVILGWTREIFTILEELVLTNIHRHNPSVLILAERDKLQMEDEIHDRVGPTRNTRVICRTGNPLEFKDLTIANLDTARSIIVLSPGEGHPDSEVLKTLFDAEGQELYLKPASAYVTLGTSLHFSTLLEAARRRGEVALGYRRTALADQADQTFGVVLNPNRRQTFSLAEQDRVIVLAPG